jgi:hypothetical protein
MFIDGSRSGTTLGNSPNNQALTATRVSSNKYAIGVRCPVLVANEISATINLGVRLLGNELPLETNETK